MLVNGPNGFAGLPPDLLEKVVVVRLRGWVGSMPCCRKKSLHSCVVGVRSMGPSIRFVEDRDMPGRPDAAVSRLIFCACRTAFSEGEGPGDAPSSSAACFSSSPMTSTGLMAFSSVPMAFSAAPSSFISSPMSDRLVSEAKLLDESAPGLSQLAPSAGDGDLAALRSAAAGARPVAGMLIGVEVVSACCRGTACGQAGGTGEEAGPGEAGTEKDG